MMRYLQHGKSPMKIATPNEHEPKTCKVCGARVTNFNPKSNTCDSICTRAKHSGLTRGQQMRQDMRRSAIAFRETQMLGELLHGVAAERFDDEHYNRPYLNALFA